MPPRLRELVLCPPLAEFFPVKLPEPEHAIADVAKLRDYTLSPMHPEGKHKARVFAAALGAGPQDVEWLREQLLAAARERDCTVGTKDAHGQRYTVDFTATLRGKSARVRSAWNVRAGENLPRLVSC